MIRAWLSLVVLKPSIQCCNCLKIGKEFCGNTKMEIQLEKNNLTKYCQGQVQSIQNPNGCSSCHNF